MRGRFRLSFVVVVAALVAAAVSLGSAQSGFVNDQPWDSLTANGWSYLKRSGTGEDTIVSMPDAPQSPDHVLQITFTRDMISDHEPSVHWLMLPKLKTVYTAWWMKLSPNYRQIFPAGGGKITFVHAGGANQIYTGLYHPLGRIGPPYRIGSNTEWEGQAQVVRLPNVTETPVDVDEWHYIEFYYQWESVPGVSRDGVIR